MKANKADNDVYLKMEKLIVELRKNPDPVTTNLAEILHHRLHQVAWTTQSELFEELHNIIQKNKATQSNCFNEEIRNLFEEVLSVIDKLYQKK